MNWLALLIFIGGILHFGILLASFSVPRVLDWKRSLQRVDQLSRQLVWLHGAFIVLVIIAFGTVSVALAEELAAGGTLARAVCGFIGFFWALRLGAQFLIVDAKPFLRNAWLKTGYYGLTLVFVYHAVVYSVAAAIGGV